MFKPWTCLLKISLFLLTKGASLCAHPPCTIQCVTGWAMMAKGSLRHRAGFQKRAGKEDAIWCLRIGKIREISKQHQGSRFSDGSDRCLGEQSAPAILFPAILMMVQSLWRRGPLLVLGFLQCLLCADSHHPEGAVTAHLLFLPAPADGKARSCQAEACLAY